MGKILGILFGAAVAAGVAFSAETPVVRGAEKAVAIAERVEGAEEVKLTATIGPDTYDYDQAIWCQPEFVMRDGSRIDATTLAPISAQAGWGVVEINRVNWSKATKAPVGGETFPRFISAHAPSTVILPVPKDAVRFEARGGRTAPRGKGSCTIKVEAGNFTRVERLANLAENAKTGLAALERLYAHRRTANPELAGSLDAVGARMAAVRTAVTAAVTTDGTVTEETLTRAEDAVRELDKARRALMIDLNPAFSFDRILFIRRKNGRLHLPCNWQSNSMLPKDGHDNELCLLDVRGATPGRTEVVYKPEGGRPIIDVELHWNADRLLFSGVAASNAWHVMELDLATRKVRQVTRDNAGDVNHYDACYVPDGRIIFTLTPNGAASGDSVELWFTVVLNGKEYLLHSEVTRSNSPLTVTVQ